MTTETQSTQRRSFRIIGGVGHLDVEIRRIPGGALEVAQTDDRGRQVGTVTICHDWEAARTKAAEMVAAALTEGAV